jgi:hypothetical protein
MFLQGSEQEINFKIIVAAAFVWYPVFLLCWFGESFSEQVLLKFEIFSAL